MKIKLNRESREKQSAIRKALGAGLPLAALFAAGCDSQETPTAKKVEPPPQGESQMVMGNPMPDPDARKSEPAESPQSNPQILMGSVAPPDSPLAAKGKNNAAQEKSDAVALAGKIVLPTDKPEK